jgi:hypothetical protein
VFWVLTDKLLFAFNPLAAIFFTFLSRQKGTWLFRRKKGAERLDMLRPRPSHCCYRKILFMTLQHGRYRLDLKFVDCLTVLSRVTRLGEFSPIGQLIPLGSFLKITDVAQIFNYFVLLFQLWINFDKNGLGYILGDCFSNSSGHLGFDLETCRVLGTFSDHRNLLSLLEKATTTYICTEVKKGLTGLVSLKFWNVDSA